MTDDLLTRARRVQEAMEWSYDRDADLVRELIAEVERLRPLAKLWERLEAVIPDEQAMETWRLLHGGYGGTWRVVIRPFGTRSKPGNLAEGTTLPEAVRALLKEVGDA